MRGGRHDPPERERTRDRDEPPRSGGESAPAVASTPSPGGLGPTDTGWLHLSLA
ncbi:hypothetical protein GA0115246_106193, partial [Streptomyces sp. SolWspMP-sol7th]